MREISQLKTHVERFDDEPLARPVLLQSRHELRNVNATLEQRLLQKDLVIYHLRDVIILLVCGVVIALAIFGMWWVNK